MGAPFGLAGDDLAGDGQAGKAIADCPTPSVWLLPVILGGGVIWAAILFAIF